MKADLVEEHRWLEQLVGTWRVTFGPPPEAGNEEPSWQDEARLLGGAWIISEMTGTMPDGSTATNILALGYDTARKRYVGSFVSSAMTHLWVYEGTLDETGRILTLDCEGPDFEAGGKTTHYQDIITIEDADSRIFSSRMQTADGSWKQVMSCRYTRLPAP